MTDQKSPEWAINATKKYKKKSTRWEACRPADTEQGQLLQKAKDSPDWPDAFWQWLEEKYS